jgi:hypothetical protein
MDSDQRWTKDRGMRGRLPTFAAGIIYGLISSFSSADVCRRLSAEPSHGENRGSSPLGSANDHNGLAGHGTRPVQNRSNIALRISGAAPPAAPCRRPGSAGRRRLCPERAPRRSRATRRRRLYERENVRFAPKATEVLRCRELTRWATRRHRTSRIRSLHRLWREVRAR